MSTLTITTIQTNLIWEDKTANMELLQQKIDTIAEKTEIVVLPEMFTTGFSMNAVMLAETMDGETIEWMKTVSNKNGIVLTGSVMIKEEDKYFNRLVWMLPNGQYGYYDKRHLFAYGEEDQHYSPGNKRLIASVKGWKINLQVCYDLRFPVWVRQQKNALQPGSEAYPEYDMIVYVANWPQRRSHAWKTLLQARAIENQCYVVGVNRVGDDGNNIHYSGDSMVVDPLGEVLYAGADKEEAFTCVLQKEKITEAREKFPFWRDADDFLIE